MARLSDELVVARQLHIRLHVAQLIVEPHRRSYLLLWLVVHDRRPEGMQGIAQEDLVGAKVVPE